MIIKALLNIIFGLIGSLLQLLPVLDFPFTQNISDSIVYMANFMGKANAFFPVADFFIVLGGYFAIPAYKFVWFIINWIIRRIADVIP